MGGQAQATALTTLELAYQLAGRPITDFELNHEKKNHVIVVSEDLQTFAHIHPDLLNTGTFTCDPENSACCRSGQSGSKPDEVLLR